MLTELEQPSKLEGYKSEAKRRIGDFLFGLPEAPDPESNGNMPYSIQVGEYLVRGNGSSHEHLSIFNHKENLKEAQKRGVKIISISEIINRLEEDPCSDELGSKKLDMVVTGASDILAENGYNFRVKIIDLAAKTATLQMCRVKGGEDLDYISLLTIPLDAPLFTATIFRKLNSHDGPAIVLSLDSQGVWCKTEIDQILLNKFA